MKKKVLLAIIGITLFIGGCSKDDVSTSMFDYDINTLIGTWEVTHMTIDGNYVDVTTPPYSSTFPRTTATFNKDGSYFGAGFFGSGSGTYKAKGKTITTFVDGVVYLKYDVLSLIGNTCELIMYDTDKSDNIKIKCRKI